MSEINVRTVYRYHRHSSQLPGRNTEGKVNPSIGRMATFLLELHTTDSHFAVYGTAARSCRRPMFDARAHDRSWGAERLSRAARPDAAILR